MTEREVDMVRWDDRLADHVWDLQLRPWLEDNTQSVWRSHTGGVWFVDPVDAVLFKLTWSGQINLTV